MKLKYTDRSLEDIDNAVTWYEYQRKGLGFEFLDCIEVAIERILRFPELYEKQYKNFRRCVIGRFPFSVYYTIEDNILIIHSVFDNRQYPDKMP